MVDAFNNAREKHIQPGRDLVIDESMSAWKGRSLYFQGATDDEVQEHFGLPHKTKIKRKPKGVGLEIRNVCCATTGILLRLELQEGKDTMQALQDNKKFGSGTASAIRLTSPWHGTKRTLAGDSAFGSVKTAREMRRRGLHFIGLVKTATREYPKAWLAKYKFPSRGSHVVMKAKDADGTTFFACGWSDRTVKTFISTCSTTLAAKVPALKPRYQLVHGQPTRVYKEVPRPAVAEDYFDAANGIDVHNHYRQGSLGLEMSWRTHTWWHRTFATLLGMTATDAYLAYKYFHPDPDKMAFSVFIRELCEQLVHNRSSTSPANNTRTCLKGKNNVLISLGDIRSLSEVMTKPNKDGRRHRVRQRRCCICGLHCSHYCVKCSSGTSTTNVCHPIGDKVVCFEEHLKRAAIYHDS
jgi:hypothetical protein